MKKIDTFQNRLLQAMQLRNKRATDLVKLTGISKQKISQYVNGQFEAKTDGIISLAKALNVSEKWLSGYDVPFDYDDFTSNWEIGQFDKWNGYVENINKSQTVINLLMSLGYSFTLQTSQSEDFYYENIVEDDVVIGQSKIPKEEYRTYIIEKDDIHQEVSESDIIKLHDKLQGFIDKLIRNYE